MLLEAMSFYMLGAGLLNNLVHSQNVSGIMPSRQEQANLLTNVQEVFEEVKKLVKDESSATNTSLNNDVDLMVKRASYTLDVVAELSLLKLTIRTNSVCSLDYHDKINSLLQKGKQTLKGCTSKGFDDIKGNSLMLSNMTDSSIDRGQAFLDLLGECSRKSGFATISCYKKVIANDVLPVRDTLLWAVKRHKEGHQRAIDIRDDANICVDGVVRKYREDVMASLELGLKCV